MNSWIKIGFGLGLLYVGVLRGAKALVVRLHSYSFKGLSVADGTASLNLNLSVYNPLLVGVTIKGVQGDVYAQGEKVGTINTEYDYYLSGRHTHILPVVVNLDMESTGKAALLNIASGDVRTLTVAFDGKLFVGQKMVGIPLRFDLNYNDLVS